jgi:hypothetical protein
LLRRSNSGGTLAATSTAPLLLPPPPPPPPPANVTGKVHPAWRRAAAQRFSDPSSSPFLGGACAAGSGRRRTPMTLRLARRPWCRAALGSELLRWSCGYGMGRRRGLSARRGRWIQAVALGRACTGLPPAWWDAALAVGSGPAAAGFSVISRCGSSRWWARAVLRGGLFLGPSPAALRRRRRVWRGAAGRWVVQHTIVPPLDGLVLRSGDAAAIPDEVFPLRCGGCLVAREVVPVDYGPRLAWICHLWLGDGVVWARSSGIWPEQSCSFPSRGQLLCPGSSWLGSLAVVPSPPGSGGLRATSTSVGFRCVSGEICLL